MTAHCKVIVMAKAPMPGQVKTRLVAALGADGSARLARRMLDETLHQARAAGIGDVELCCAPDASHDAFAAHAASVQLSVQGDGDLGARMARALERALRASDAAILVGTDAPALDAAVLRTARDALRGHDAVFVPAADGGYVLIGLRAPTPALLDAMPWSTPRVMDETRARLARLGLRHAELPTLHDVDEPADLRHVPTSWR
jgi:rSAM/selenodomain-associated transferase 1